MNELGWTLGWLAIQVAALLLPAIGLHALASRRGPASGAWVATLSLGMVVILAILTLMPIPHADYGKTRPAATPPSVASLAKPVESNPAIGNRTVETAVSGLEPARVFSRLRLAWRRFEQRAVEPVARVRPWGRAWAWLTLAGSGLGLVRLAVGLGAIGLCRRRGRPVDEPGMVGMVEDLRQRMGIGRPVEVRELPDLTTPATAGWLRPMLLLPEDWRGWDDPERRAVVAHELAHVARGDYAAGLLARLAEVLHPFHPLVRWMAGRLHLEQELAADAMGASFAGGRTSYLRALSKLTLEQEGRPSCWPARAFLPARGTLIRRIAMLKDESKFARMTPTHRGMTRPASALGLLALAIAVANWKGPASVAGDQPNPPTTKPAEVAAAVEPFDVRFVPETMKGAIAFRPAATAKRAGMAGLTPWLREIYEEMFAEARKGLGVDPGRPGFRKVACEDVESVVLGINIDKFDGPGGTTSDGKPLPKPSHRLMFSGFTVRTVAPYDWVGFFRQWKLVVTEVREGSRTYHRIKLPVDVGGINLACFLPDDRTMVLDDEAWIKTIAGRESQQPPAFLRGADWDRASRGIVALAIDNAGDRTSKEYDLARPDDAMALPLFRGVERWTLGVADRDEIALNAEATARSPKDAGAVAMSILALKAMGLAGLAVAKDPNPTPLDDRTRAIGRRVATGLLSELKVEAAGPAVAVRFEGAGTIAEVLAIVQGFYTAEAAEARAEQAKAAQAPLDVERKRQARAASAKQAEENPIKR